MQDTVLYIDPDVKKKRSDFIMQIKASLAFKHVMENSFQPSGAGAFSFFFFHNMQPFIRKSEKNNSSGHLVLIAS